MKIRSLQIENFRAIGRLALENLGDTVVIAGPNGCGKTQVYHAIRLLKSTYGGYQANEYQQWWGEFQIRLDRPTMEIFRIFRDPKRPLRLEADFELEPAEIAYLRNNAADLIRPRIWEELVPGTKGRHTSDGAPIAQAHRVHGPAIERRTAEEVDLLLEATSSTHLSAVVTVNADLRFIVKPNPGLEVLFSTYAPGHLGVIDYHGAQRNYNREELGSINLDIQSSEDRFRPHMLYNWQNKYNNVKSELAAAYVRGLIAAEAGIPRNASMSLADTLQNLFATFFPGKTFLGPTPGPNGTLDFPVRLESGATHDIDDLSSGEKEVLFGYLRLRNNAPRNSVVLIDEPELHLNPALLRGFPQFYHQHIGRNLQNQLWLVTHSDALLREALGQPGFSVFHMQPAEATEATGNQIQAVEVGELLDRALVDLVGDLATYRPGAKVAFFEGGGDVDFDVRMTATLFPRFVEKVNAISAGHRARVEQVHDLLRKASESGSLGARFFSVVDRDSGPVERAADAFQWDRYHIESYLLEPEYILAVLKDLNASKHPVASVDQIRDQLMKCAGETLPDLVRHELELSANRALISAIKTRTPREENEIGPALRAAVVASGARVAEAIDKTLTLKTLSKDEKVARGRFAADLRTDMWLRTFRGRDVLKRFVAHHLGGVSYETFRDLVLARMGNTGFKPEGMRKVLDDILAAGMRPKRLQPTKKRRADVATRAKTK